MFKMSVSRELPSILRTLNTIDTHKQLSDTRNLLYEILTLSTNGFDVASALPTVVKLQAHSDAFIKRVAGEIVSAHTENNPDMVLLAVNTLVQDCRDVNPVVRGIAIRALGSLKSNVVTEFLKTSVANGLEDSNAYVKRSAALAVTSLYNLSPSTVLESNIWDTLYSLLRDSDPVTVASCLCSLEEIFSHEKGIVISNKLGQYLIANLTSFTPAVQKLVLQFLTKYSPKTKSQMFENLNDLDEFLSNGSSLGMTLCALELFSHCSSSMSRVRAKAFATAWASIKTNLSRQRSEEYTGAVIAYINNTDFPPEVCLPDFSKFLSRDDDSQFLMNQKIKLLSRLLSPENAETILKEFAVSARRVNTDILQDMIQNVLSVMKRKPELEKAGVDFLTRLVQLDNAEILEIVVQALSTVQPHDPDTWSSLMVCIGNNCHTIHTPVGQTALLRLIKHQKLNLENDADILENILIEFEENNGTETSKCGDINDSSNLGSVEKCQELKLSLLGAMVSCCLKSPARMQPLLAKYMEQCIHDPDRHVRDRALFLYGYLEAKVKQQLREISN